MVKHYIKEQLVTKQLRILRYQISQDFMGSSVCLRAEVYGCYFDSSKLSLIEYYTCIRANGGCMTYLTALIVAQRVMLTTDKDADLKISGGSKHCMDLFLCLIKIMVPFFCCNLSPAAET